jgi:hypothetical protein
VLHRLRSAAVDLPLLALDALRAAQVPARRIVLAPYRHFGRGLRLRRDLRGGLDQLAILLLGLAGGLLLAFPVPNVEKRCPARGEGYDFCWVQKALAPSVLILLASLFLAQFVARALLVRWPAWREHVRTVGERRVGEEETREEPPYRSDPFLLASTWGAKVGRTERRRPRLFDRRPKLLARLLRR